MSQKRLNVRLTEDDYTAITQLARSQNKTISELIRDSLALEKWFYERQKEGDQVLVQRRGEQHPKRVVMAR